MKWSIAGAVALLGAMLGLVGLQIWLGERQQDLQRRQIDLQRQLNEQHQAALQLSLTQPIVAGQPRMLPPPPPPPIVFTPPPLTPFFPIFYPALLGLSMLLVQTQQKKIDKERHAEEEDRTPYTEEELMQGWEFKIIRSPVGLFDRPAFLEHVLREEATAGWQLVEKFDATRVRLKRLAGQTSAELSPGYDPFRTLVGPRMCLHVLFVIVSVACAAMAAAFGALQIFDPIRPSVVWTLVAIALAGAAAFGLLAVRMRSRYRKLTHQK